MQDSTYLRLLTVKDHINNSLRDLEMADAHASVCDKLGKVLKHVHEGDKEQFIGEVSRYYQFKSGGHPLIVFED